MPAEVSHHSDDLVPFLAANAAYFTLDDAHALPDRVTAFEYVAGK